jgi:acyl-coenzyme A thioesterase PaaI-like protein
MLEEAAPSVAEPSVESRRRTFASVTALTPDGLRGDGRGRFRADLDTDWTIGGRPNGGYLTAILGRAAAQVGTHPHVIAASAHFLRPPEPGEAAVEAEILRSGRSASQVRASLSQDGKCCVEALLTTARLDPTAEPTWSGGLPPISEVSYEECDRLVPRLPDGIRVPIMEQVEVRLEPACTGFFSGRPSGRGELRGWLALPEDEPFTPTSLLYAVDAFPPATFEIAYAGWVPTLELSVYVRALPAPGPVRVLQRAQLIEAQRVDESCFVWDATGRLVAQGTQLAGVRLG